MAEGEEEVVEYFERTLNPERVNEQRVQRIDFSMWSLRGGKNSIRNQESLHRGKKREGGTVMETRLTESKSRVREHTVAHKHGAHEGGG